MILAARQLGWAHSVPDGPDGKRGEKSQIEIARANGGDVTLPPQRCPYLFEWLCQAGPAQSGAMGPVGLSASELQAWASCSAIELQPWEFAALQRASRAYCAAYASADDCPPWGGTDGLSDPAEIEKRMMKAMRSI